MLQPYRVLPFLRSFEAVARLGHVRAASLEMHLTPGAVSHQIKLLEELMAQPMFTRESRRMNLTPAGRRFQRDVAGLMRELRLSLDAIAPGAGPLPDRRLSVAASSGLGHIWLAPKLPGLSDQLGLNSIESHIAREVSQVDWRRVDLAIVYDNPPWTGYRWSALPELRLSPLCSPSLLHVRQLRQPRDLARHRLLHEDNGAEWQRWCSAAQVTSLPARNAYYNRLSMAFNAALSGDGLALVSDFLANEYLSSGQLVRPFQVSIPAAKRYHLVVPENRLQDPLIARAFELLLDLIRKDIAPD